MNLWLASALYAGAALTVLADGVSDVLTPKQRREARRGWCLIALGLLFALDAYRWGVVGAELPVARHQTPPPSLTVLFVLDFIGVAAVFTLACVMRRARRPSRHDRPFVRAGCCGIVFAFIAMVYWWWEYLTHNWLDPAGVRQAFNHALQALEPGKAPLESIVFRRVLGLATTSLALAWPIAVTIFFASFAATWVLACFRRTRMFSWRWLHLSFAEGLWILTILDWGLGPVAGLNFFMRFIPVPLYVVGFWLPWRWRFRRAWASALEVASRFWSVVSVAAASIGRAVRTALRSVWKFARSRSATWVKWASARLKGLVSRFRPS